MKKSIPLTATIALLSTAAQTTTASWGILWLGHGQNVANYSSLTLNSAGRWAVAFDDAGNGKLKCDILNLDGRAYTVETVMNGGVGACVAFGPDENEVSISHVAGTKLYFVTKIGSTWTSKQLETKDIYPGDTGLVYDGDGSPCISYFKTGRHGGLWFARRNGPAWTTQRVDADAHAVYNQMVVDGDGNPVIAYSADGNGDGTVDTLKVAHRVGTGWEVETVDEGGQFASLGYDPMSGNLAVAHWSATDGELRFQLWDGIGWSVPENVDPTVTSATGCSVDFDLNGTAYVGFSAPELRLAQRDPDTGAWSVQVVDPTAPGAIRNSLKAGRFLPCLAYRGPLSKGYYPTSALLAIQRTP